jgi:iron(III) transport system ATP-binding protein
VSIDVVGLHKAFGGATAVAGVDIALPNGQMLVLLGPSGCGKTTTMRCIAGLEMPDAGTISIDGVTVFDRAASTAVPVHKRNVGMVFQSYAIWPHMTVFQNVAFPLEMQRIPDAELKARVMETLEKVGLANFAGRASSALSGGQMQRVALARSLVMRPSVLLFDEPLSNLDARLRDRLRVQLRELQAELKITGIYVTHDQQEALALADRIMVMDHGLVRQSGTPVELYASPATSAIAAFLGYSNIFPTVEWQATAGGFSARLASGRALSDEGVTPAPGTGAAVCVRPEDLSLRLASPDDTGLVGEVTLASFMGAFTLYRVRLSEGETWEVISHDVLSGIAVGSRVAIKARPMAMKLLATQ